MISDQALGHAGYRHATEADIEAEHAVFLAAEGALLRRHGFEWPEPPPAAAAAAGLRHLLRNDGGRCFVATVDDRVVGYSAAWVRGETWFLASLFIDPGYQGIGVGRRLLELALDGAPPRRLTISDSIQPISNALYAKHGMLPTTPILGFEGEATIDGAIAAAITGPAALAAAEPMAPEPTADALARLDQAAYGFDRAVDHAFLAAEATRTLWLRGGEPVAYSYRWPRGRIGPLAGLDEESAAAALAAELTRRPSAMLDIPGTSRSLVHLAIGAGLRLVPPPGLLLTSDGVEPPRSLAIASYGLL